MSISTSNGKVNLDNRLGWSEIEAGIDGDLDNPSGANTEAMRRLETVLSLARRGRRDLRTFLNLVGTYGLNHREGIDVDLVAVERKIADQTMQSIRSYL